MFQLLHEARITCDKMLKKADKNSPDVQCMNDMTITGLPAETSFEAFKAAGWSVNPDGDICLCPVHAKKPETDEEK